MLNILFHAGKQKTTFSDKYISTSQSSIAGSLSVAHRQAQLRISKLSKAVLVRQAFQAQEQMFFGIQLNQTGSGLHSFYKNNSFIRLHFKEQKSFYYNYLQNTMNNSEPNAFSDRNKLPEPVYYARIDFVDDGNAVGYTDCWEISTLRFLHLIFGQEGLIDQERLTKFMDLNDPHCQYLVAYFKENPIYHLDQEYYKTEQGFLIRAKWGQFLNKSGLLDLKLQKKYEVKATYNNLLSFYKGFFPKLSLKLQEVDKLTVKNAVSQQIFKQYEKALNSVYSQLSQKYKIRTELEVQCDDNGMTFFLYSANQKIFVDGQHLFEWTINEYYNIDQQQLSDRIGGHSDYRFHKK